MEGARGATERGFRFVDGHRMESREQAIRLAVPCTAQCGEDHQLALLWVLVPLLLELFDHRLLAPEARAAAGALARALAFQQQQVRGGRLWSSLGPAVHFAKYSLAGISSSSSPWESANKSTPAIPPTPASELLNATPSFERALRER